MAERKGNPGALLELGWLPYNPPPLSIVHIMQHACAGWTLPSMPPAACDVVTYNLETFSCSTLRARHMSKHTGTIEG